MEIQYFGQSCFRIKTSKVTMVIDPFDPNDSGPVKKGLKLPKLDADVVLVTHDHSDHNYAQGVSGYRLLVHGPGEYEIADVHIIGIPSFHDNSKGKERGLNTMYFIQADGINLLHCGDLGHELEKDILEKLDSIDVLMVPVGGFYTIDSEQAVKVISSIEPYKVIPMHYSTPEYQKENLDLLDKFLDEMGVENGAAVPLEKLKISGRGDLGSETEVVVLKF